jgi:SIR2-like domain
MKKILIACTLTFLAFGGASPFLAGAAISLQPSSIPQSNSNTGKFPANTNGNAIITNRNRNASPSNSPYIVRVEPDAAPSGAIIELWLQYEIVPDSPPPMRVEIGGVAAEIVQVDKSKLAVIVPRFDAPSPPPEGSVTANIRLFFENKPSTVFKNFRVLSSVVSKIPSTQIAAIEEIPSSHETVNIRLSSGIPVALWGLVKFYVNDRPVEKINRMTPRLFTITLPSDLPEKPSYAVFFTIGEQYQSNTFSFSPPWYEKPTSSLPLPIQSETSIVIMVVIGAAGLLAGLVTAFYFFRRAARNAKSKSKADTKIDQNNVERLRLPEEVPADLLDVCVAGECVLYAGAGLSAQSGLPTWKDFVHKLLDWALDNHFINADEAATYHAEVDTGHADPVADSVISRLGTARDQSLLNKYLREVFLRRRSPSTLHSQLVRIKFSAALTTNFDDLLERVYDTPPEQVYTPNDTESLLAALTRGDFFLLKLYGTLDQPDTVMVAPKQYEDAITGNRLFSQFMETLFFSRTLLFIGASLEGIETYLRGISLPKNVTRRHYALVAITETSWRAQADLLERRFGIKVLPYSSSDDYAELRDFLSRLTAGRSKPQICGKSSSSREEICGNQQARMGLLGRHWPRGAALRAAPRMARQRVGDSAVECRVVVYTGAGSWDNEQ